MSALLLCFTVSLQAQDLLETRKGHKTKLVKEYSNDSPLLKPPKDLFQLIEYPSQVGKLKALLGIPKDKSKKSPAIIWLTGGFPVGGFGEYAWAKVKSNNEQSARSYRLAGMVMMYPTFRGDHGNPGKVESYYGEVNDVISAYEYLSKLDYIDKDRIYLGGHSSGATLALLTAAATDKFRGVIAFGPSLDPVDDYSAKYFYHDIKDAKENKLRAPKTFLKSIKTPTLVMEGGTLQRVSFQLDRDIKKENTKIITAFPRYANHFNILYPLNEKISNDLMKDPDAISSYTKRQLEDTYKEFEKNQREAKELRTLAYHKSEGLELKVTELAFYFYTYNKHDTLKIPNIADANGFSFKKNEKKTKKGKIYYELVLTKKIDLNNLKEYFEASRITSIIQYLHRMEYDGWEVVE